MKNETKNVEQATKPYSKRLVSELRKRLDLPNDSEVSDEEILKCTDQTHFRASVELHLAIIDLGRTIKKSIQPVTNALEKAKRELSRYNGK